MKKRLLLLTLSTSLLFTACENKTEQTQNVNIGDNPSKSNDSAGQETKKEETPKTKTEVIAGAIINVAEVVTEEMKAKGIRDSIELAKRGKVLAYQIGLPKNNKDELWNSYSKMKNSKSIYAFDVDNKYYLVKVKNFTEQGMQDSLSIITARLAKGGITDQVKVIDMMQFCKKKETVVQGDKVKIKGHDDIPCYVCD